MKSPNLSGKNEADFNNQFSLPSKYYNDNVDIVSWLRYFWCFKEINRVSPNSILEIGPGAGIIQSLFKSKLKYDTFDINDNLSPTYLGDLRQICSIVNKKYDLIVICDVLEHLPYEILYETICSLKKLLHTNGRLLITIPHRRSYFLLMTPHYIPRVLSLPTGFLSIGSFYRRFIKRKIFIDPHHMWEIGDGKHDLRSVQKLFKDAQFTIERQKRLIYVESWVLKNYQL